MKPLFLSLEGLQSYRERQEIDFRQMEGCGLFGIFGPTGSGKSTVLDAMTLALYGVVSRASHNTQGIINSNCESLTVGFTFSLQLGQDESTYRVERIYRRRRQQPDSSEARVGRLIRLDKGIETVIADKPTDVTQAVEDLIGLKFSDFVRAVVLPQNQFQEFLLLGKKEKSDMLERLFCLEEYGSSLSRKIIGSRKNCEEQMQTAKGALDALADSSDEQVALLSSSSRAAALERKEAQSRHEVMRLRHEDQTVRYQLTRERNELLKQQSDQDMREPAVEMDRRRMQLAQLAEPIWPLWQDVGRLRRQDDALKKEQTSLEPTLVLARNKLSENRTKLTRSLLTADEDRERLNMALSRLEKALSLAVQLEQNQEDSVRTGQQVQILKKQIENLEKQTALTLDRTGTLEQQLEDGRLLRRAAGVDPGWRQVLENWVQLRRQRMACQEDIQAAGNSLTGLTGLVQVRQAAFDRIISQVSSEDAVLFQAAAAHLEPGKPCPVCGSTDHPAPAMPGTSDKGLPTAAEQEGIRREMIQGEEQLKTARQKLAVLVQTLAELDGAARTQTGLHPELQVLDEPGRCLEELYERERQSVVLDRSIQSQELMLPELRRELKHQQEELAGLLKTHARDAGQLDLLTSARADLGAELGLVLPGWPIEQVNVQTIKTASGEARTERASFDRNLGRMQDDDRVNAEQLNILEQSLVAVMSRRNQNEEHLRHSLGQFEEAMKKVHLEDASELERIRLDPAVIAAIKDRLQAFDNDRRDVQLKLIHLDEKLQDRMIDEPAWLAGKASYQMAAARLEQAVKEDDQLLVRLQEMEERRRRRLLVQAEYEQAAAQRDRIGQIEYLVRGNAFVEYVAEERLRAIAAEASGFLQTLSRGRFALELDSESAFVIRDQMNGGQVRSASTLSGGETFMASLALALALSAQIQIRGQSRLAFFFLDEGFGSLDHDLLDQVMDALERVGSRDRLIGLISHVQELQQRLPVSLVISAADNRRGSRIDLQKS